MKFIFLLSSLVSGVFLIIVLSYYFLIFARVKPQKNGEKFRSLTVIIPAHNEEKFIGACIRSVKNAGFNGPKKIIVVNDGSTDSTEKEIKKELGSNVRLINTRHRGKANSINLAVKQSGSGLIAIVDADSTISKTALMELADAMGPKEFGAATGIVKVKNRKSFLGMWLHIEQIYNSLIRKALSKANANIVTPGPLSMYRKSALDAINGFSSKGYSEDVDVAVRLIRKGYKIGFSENSVSETIMPRTFMGFVRQRARFAKGWINIFKKHIGIGNGIVDVYSLPLALFFYLQAVIMSFVILYNIISGYMAYFYSKGVYFSLHVAKYFIDWLSIVGSVKWIANIFSGIEPLTFLTIVSLATFILTYPLYFIAIIKYDKNIDLWHIIPIFFMTPYWLVIMVIYTFNIFEALRAKQSNIWEKNA